MMVSPATATTTGGVFLFYMAMAYIAITISCSFSNL